MAYPRLAIFLWSWCLLGCATRESSAGPPASFTDGRDGRVYSVLTIGTQRWLGKNLKYATPTSRCYDNEAGNCERYGRLYPFAEARVACPPGWRLPTEADWQRLERTLGLTQVETKRLRVWHGRDEGRDLQERFAARLAGIDAAGTPRFLGRDRLVY